MGRYIGRRLLQGLVVIFGVTVFVFVVTRLVGDPVKFMLPLSATPEQRARYEEYAAKRTPRTTSPQGPARLMFAPDIVGTSAEIAERLHAHVAFREVDEVAFALPFTFDHEDYVQILTDMATRLGPALGWQPSA